MEEKPKDIPVPKGKIAHLTVYLAADHAHDQVTGRSMTEILLWEMVLPSSVVQRDIIQLNHLDMELN